MVACAAEQGNQEANCLEMSQSKQQSQREGTGKEAVVVGSRGGDSQPL